MLIKNHILVALKDGQVDLAFRQWKKLVVMPNSTFKTTVGLVRIVSVTEISQDGITEADAARAGYTSKEAVLSELSKRDGKTYRIELAYAGPDIRLKLRESDDLADKEVEEIYKKLQAFDKRSKLGSWTKRVMESILENPNTKATTLADSLGYEKEWLKLNVRKLKNLGLTISHEPGYEISPRGKEFLKRQLP